MRLSSAGDERTDTDAISSNKICSLDHGAAHGASSYVSKNNTTARREADQLFEDFLTAYRLGKSPRREEFLARCPEPERDRLGDAIAGFLFTYENYYAGRVREEAVQSAMERLQKVRRRKQALAEARARADAESWERMVTQPLLRLSTVLYPNITTTTMNRQGVGIIHRTVTGTTNPGLDKDTQRYIDSFTCGEAERLLSRVGVTSTPVPLYSIAEQLCLLVRETPMQDIEGCLVTNGDTGGILLNSLSESRRKRFTLAHEIGHYTLHRSSQYQFSDKESEIINPNSRLEIEANSFASYLLLPPTLLPKTFGRDIPSFRDVDTVSEQFDVSILAVLKRLVSQSDYRTTLISFGNGRREWFNFSPEVEGFNRVVSQVPLGSAAAALIDENATDTYTRDVPANVWFVDGQFVNEGIILTEESRRFSTGHIYTLLSVIEK